MWFHISSLKTQMTCYRNVFHHHLSWLEEFQIDSRYFLLKTLSLFCDHCFGLELPLSILKHNLLQLICTRNQMMEERALSQSRERLERDALPKWASPLVCSPGSDWAPVFTSSTDDFGLFLWASWLLCWCQDLDFIHEGAWLRHLVAHTLWVCFASVFPFYWRFWFSLLGINCWSLGSILLGCFWILFLAEQT